ncbi:MAG: hypothetical protein IJA75_09225 [Oscillospiraceae bacterium]|nr:hypothetical protein [Oscillospiraceae bacterium]
MKRTILALLLCLLLSGCGRPADETLPVSTQAPQPSAEAHGGFYAPGSDLEAQTQGAVRVYPLSIPSCRSFTAMGEDILLFSDAGLGTRLTVLTGDTLAVRAETEITAWLQDQYEAVTADAEGVFYFDGDTWEAVLLDEGLREITRIPVPADISGLPLLSPDRKTLYYCVGNELYALELETRLPRVLRQFGDDHPVPDKLHLEGSVLKCSGYSSGWNTLFVSTQNGQLLREAEGWYDLASHADLYIASFHREDTAQLVFGEADGKPQTLYLPQGDAQTELLEKSFGVLNILPGQEDIRLHYYDLTTGKRTSTLTLEGDGFPSVLDGGNGILWLLTSDPLGENHTILRWDTNALPSGDDTIYTADYYPRSQPDVEGIARCQFAAWELGERYGIEILLWEDVMAYVPENAAVTTEYLVPVLDSSLARLEEQLSRFPEGFFRTLTEDFSGLTVCLVRSIVEETGADCSAGLQYWLGDRACIALSAANAVEGSFYHQLSHVLDTRIFAHSNAYDEWEEINPGGFDYDYDYIANAGRNAGEYLRDAQRRFIDTYSMSFPREDRARILEYAMTEGNAHYFRSETMQKKLLQVCLGIREAFGLKKSPETFLWEQYLEESLAYGK